MTHRWPARVVNGVVEVLPIARYRRHLRNLEGKSCLLTIEKFEDQKEDELRAYYFKFVMRPFSAWSGETEEDIHHSMKIMFNFKEVLGQRVAVSVFSKNSKMNKEDKLVFIKKVRDFIWTYAEIETEPWGGIE